MLDALPGSSYTNGFGFSSRSWPQREFHSCYAGPGYLSGRLVFDGAGTAPFPLSTVMQTSLLAGALTSSSLMSCYRYASHVSIFPFWTFLLLHLPHNPSPHTLPSLPSPARARTQEGLKQGSPSHLGSLKTKKKALNQKSGNKGDMEQDTSSSWAFFAHYSNGFHNACATYLTGTL